MDAYPKQLIEVDLPIKRISARAPGKIDSTWTHFDNAHLVGASAVSGVPGLRGDQRLVIGAIFLRLYFVGGIEGKA